MLDASSYGRAAPKPKTINVQANLLAQRNAERERVRTASKRRLVSLLVVVGIASVVLPPSWGAADRVARLADESAAKNATVHAELRDIQARQANLKPILDEMAVRERIQANVKMMLGEVASLLNAANPQVAFSGVRAEAQSGELRVGVAADAETYAAARDYVTVAGEGSQVKSSALVSMRRSDVLGADGVRFEFMRKVGVSK